MSVVVNGSHHQLNSKGAGYMDNWARVNNPAGNFILFSSNCFLIFEFAKTPLSLLLPNGPISTRVNYSEHYKWLGGLKKFFIVMEERSTVCRCLSVWICFPSNAPATFGKFQISSKSITISNQSVSQPGYFSDLSIKTSLSTIHVSLMNVTNCCSSDSKSKTERLLIISPDAKNRRISAKRSSAGIECQKRVPCFDNLWRFSWSRCANLSGDMRISLKQKADITKLIVTTLILLFIQYFTELSLD